VRILLSSGFAAQSKTIPLRERHNGARVLYLCADCMTNALGFGEDNVSGRIHEAREQGGYRFVSALVRDVKGVLPILGGRPGVGSGCQQKLDRGVMATVRRRMKCRDPTLCARVRVSAVGEQPAESDRVALACGRDERSSLVGSR
jgi:hypothetical protein